MTSSRYHPLIVAGLLASLAGGCKEEQRFEGECATDADCPVGAYCLGDLCACRSSEACAEGEFCNSQHLCQRRAGCRENGDCPDPASTFCDVGSGQCIPKTGCGSDAHCVAGQVCDVQAQRCIDGCYDHSDCPLYSICQKAVDTPTTRGACLSDRCGDRSYCAYGEVCNGGMCAVAPDPNHCIPCDPASPTACGDPANFCLINVDYDASDPSTGASNYCGVECDPANDTCPNGYNCSGVILLTQDLCTQNSECCDAANAAECCPDGDRSCDNKRICVGGEGHTRGSCTCLTDEDCAIDKVPPSCLGSCAGLGIQQCTSDADCITTCQFKCQWPQPPGGQACTQDSECESLPLCATLPTGSICVWSGGPGSTPVSCTSSTECLCMPDSRPGVPAGRKGLVGGRRCSHRPPGVDGQIGVQLRLGHRRPAADRRQQVGGGQGAVAQPIPGIADR